MAEDITFLDLAALIKIGSGAQLERLGSALNSSIFDASNIAGALKQKGLIEFTANYPGPNNIIVTEAGKALVAEADSRSAEAFDRLDETILSQLSGGKRLPIELQNTLGIRSKDLAMRLYKLFKQGYMSYEIKNGNVEILLTEKGFLSTKAADVQAYQQSSQQLSEQANAPTQQATPMETEIPSRSRKHVRRTIFAVAAIAVIIIAIAVMEHFGLIQRI